MSRSETPAQKQLKAAMAGAKRQKAARAKGKTEAELALEIRQWLQTRGWRVHRLTADQRAGAWQKKHEREEPGTADYVCLKPVLNHVGIPQKSGWVDTFYWEAKREKGGKIRPVQRAWIDDARKRGYLVLEAPRSVQDVEDWLREEELA